MAPTPVNEFELWYSHRVLAARDVKIKFAALAAGTSLARIVHVETIDPTVEDPEAQVKHNYEVVYVNRLFGDNPARYQTFTRYSSPTEKRPIKAGLYLFWCRRPVGDGEYTTGPRREIEILKDMKDTSIQVEVPFEHRERPGGLPSGSPGP